MKLNIKLWLVVDDLNFKNYKAHKNNYYNKEQEKHLNIMIVFWKNVLICLMK
jgi:hypothetical protein